jgi:hypothetical protein
MKNNILEQRPGLRRLIRIAEIVVVVILGAYAALTYRELKSLRAVPVILPAYWFYVAAVADEVQRVQARGSWVSKESSPEFLHTTTIECVKAKMQCMESSAVVAVNEGGFLETVQTMFDIESWSDKQIVTKPDIQSCATRTLTLDIASKQAKSVVMNTPTQKNCKASPAGEQVFKLMAGNQSRGATGNKEK